MENNSGFGIPGFNFLTMSESLAEVGVAPGKGVAPGNQSLQWPS